MTQSFTVTGNPVVGQVLSAATWFSYQWYRSGVPIAGATGPTYTAVKADEGHTLSVSWGMASLETASVTSPAVQPPGVPVNTALPVIS
jgi:hypothetical protein